MSVVTLSSVIGMPPSTHVSNSVLYNSMPIAEIHPHEPSFSAGMTVFTLTNAWGKYSSIVSAHGFTVQKPLKVAFLADNFPTDTFGNEYGESFLQKFTDFASGAVGDIAQMTNFRNATQFMDELSAKGGMAGEAGRMGKNAIEEAAAFLDSSKPGSLVHSLAKTAVQLATGAKVDFPQVWKGSSFSPSYSMTVRLYNPDPKSKAATLKYIVGPICALLCLSLPRTIDGNCYKWPFLFKLCCKGIYGLNPAYISNVAIVKGGDQQNIAFNQRLSIVDVRLDFGSIYNSIMINEQGGTGTMFTEKRPYLSGYLDSLTLDKPTKSLPTTKAPPGAGVASPSKISSTKDDKKPKELSKTVNQEPAKFETPPPARKNPKDSSSMATLTKGPLFSG